MSIRIIYKLDNNSIAIITPVGNLSIDAIAKRDVPPGVPYKIIDSSMIPKDRTFRDAWEINFDVPDGYGIGKDAEIEETEDDSVSVSYDSTIDVNMPKAIEIKKQTIRQNRLALFEQLDVQFMRALEAADTEKQKEIVEKKQMLRDATTHSSIVNATTPEDLKLADPLAEIQI